MKRTNCLFLVMTLAFLLPAVSSSLLAQAAPQDGFGGHPNDVQTRNIPAGSVNDPGSHLTYIVDTGVNPRNDDVNLSSFGGTVLEDLAADLDADGDGELDTGAVFTNFVQITNTHPTHAVTIHFRYYNDNCEDVLDFLVVLTCNDTLIFDPFNFEIPQSGGENTRDRIFGPQRPGKVFEPIPTTLFGSGRFVITAAASGASTDTDDLAELLFPSELDALDGECDIDFNPTGGSNGGTVDGINGNNLHVFNASQICHDYLIGQQSTAVPDGFVTDLPAEVDAELAYMVRAWARPCVDRTADDNNSAATGNPDGDGPNGDAAFDRRIVTGREPVVRANPANGTITVNSLFLRNEVHGGDIEGIAGSNVVGGNSNGGAIGIVSIMGTTPDNQLFHFLSASDDYDGSNNAGVTGVADNSANISPAITTYVVQIYDNEEDVLDFDIELPLNVSPPKPGEVIELKMVCICLRTWLTSVIAEGTNVDDVTIQEMDDIYTSVLDGSGAFDGLDPDGDGNLGDPTNNDLSAGWIRWVRDGSMSPATISSSTAAAVGLSFSGTAHGNGTSTFDVTGLANSDVNFGPSFLTIAQHILKFRSFGAAVWLHAVAYDSCVESTGDPGCDPVLD